MTWNYPISPIPQRAFGYNGQDQKFWQNVHLIPEKPKKEVVVGWNFYTSTSRDTKILWNQSTRSRTNALSESVPLGENSVGDVLGILSISFGPDVFVANENILK